MAKEVKEVTEELKSVLRNEKVLVRRIKKFNNGINDKNHPLYGGMVEGADFVVQPKMLRNGDYTNVLTKEEKDFLEVYMQLDPGTLSMYNKKYWDEMKVILGKDDIVLDLTDPTDYILYKILETHDNLVAASLDSMYKKASYKYVLIKQNEEEHIKESKLSDKSKAYIEYGSIKNKKEALIYVIKTLTNRIPSSSSKLLHLQNKVGELIETRYDEFLIIVSDKFFDDKVLLDNALRVGAITKRGDDYFSLEGKPMSVSGGRSPIEEAVKFINAPLNQELKFTIEARIQAAKE